MKYGSTTYRIYLVSPFFNPPVKKTYELFFLSVPNKHIASYQNTVWVQNCTYDDTAKRGWKREQKISNQNKKKHFYFVRRDLFENYQKRLQVCGLTFRSVRALDTIFWGFLHSPCTLLKLNLREKHVNPLIDLVCNRTSDEHRTTAREHAR